MGHCGTDTTTAATIRFFRAFFRDLGVPGLRTDGGPQFTSHDFNVFSEDEVSSMTSPDHVIHKAMGTMKAVKHHMKVSPSGNIKDCKVFEIRNALRPDGRGPPQILYGSQLDSCIPAHAVI